MLIIIANAEIANLDHFGETEHRITPSSAAQHAGRHMNEQEPSSWYNRSVSYRGNAIGQRPA